MNRFMIILLSVLALSSCIGTDLIEDQVIIISIMPIDADLVNESDLSGLVGDEKAFSASAMNDRGSTFVPEVVWNSSNTDVAMIDEGGNVTLVSNGTSIISATGYGIESNAINLSVRDNATEPAIIDFGPLENINTTLQVGESIQLTVDVLNASGDVLENIEVEWSSSNESIYTVDNSGLVTGINEGTATITATAGEASSSITFSTTESMMNIRQGEFRGLNGYRAEGNVELVESSNGLELKLLDNFSTSSGPGLYLYLSNNENNVSGGIELGQLRSNSGADTYEVPSGITFNQYEHVIIYCKPFGVGFGTASLE